jgi:hypothetical protein
MLADCLRFSAWVLLGLVGPGIGLMRLTRVAVDPALVLPLGATVAAAGYWLWLLTSWPPAALLVLLALDLVALLGWRTLAVAKGPGLRGAIPAFACLVLVLAMTQYPWNRLDKDGRLLIDPLVPFDSLFHAGLTFELTLGYPPQVPGVAGFPLGYHLGIDLLRAAALRFAEVHPLDSITRFDVTLWGLGLLLVLRGLTARLFPSSRMALAVVGFTLLATDLSFVFFANPNAHWWADLLRGNLLLSLCLANPVVPALCLTLGSLIALCRHESGEGTGWLPLAGLMATAVPFFKVFLGAHLVLGLLAAALAGGARARRCLLVGLGPLLATAALALGTGGRTVSVTLSPLDLVRVTLESLGLGPDSGPPFWAWAVVWILSSLGLRVLGIPEAARALRQGSSAARASAAMALAAWPIGLLFRVTARDLLPGQKPVNDAAYLLEQGGPLLWVFTVAWLASACRTRRQIGLSLAAVLCLATPSTIQYALKKRSEPSDPLPAPMVRAALALREVGRPGDVVLQRPRARYPPAPVILTGQRVTYERFTPYSTQFAPKEQLAARHAAVHRFFRTRDAGEARTIAQQLGARFVCLYENDRLRFADTAWLEPVYEEKEARCYRVRPATGQ